MLSTDIAGIPLINPLMNASGCWCTDAKQMDEVYISRAAAVVSKSGTILLRDGNIHPRIYLDEFGAINAMGLPNSGYKYYYTYGQRFKSKESNSIKKPFFQSIHPFSVDELNIMMPSLQNSLIELNISCPNVDNTFSEYERYFDKMHIAQATNVIKIWGVKLPPFYHAYEFEHMSSLILKYEANFITSINSMPNGLLVDNRKFEISNKSRIAPRGGLGGISGAYIKPFGLANVYQFSKILGQKIDIIGCGGISTGEDVMDYLTVGAKAVQVGTQLLREGPKCFARIESELALFQKPRAKL